MSIMTRFTAAAAAAFAVTAVVSLTASGVLANTKGPSDPLPRPPMGGAASHNPKQPHHYNPAEHSPWKQKCYWLPTVANGTVTGLEQKCIWVKK